MSREILFRGKRLVYDYWVEGGGIHRPKSINYLNYLGSCYIAGMGERANDWVQVDPATVGQYTFLNDIDDKKIFTADILQDKITEELYVVDFIGGGFGLFTMKEYLDLKHRHQVILWDGLSEPQTACFVTQNLEVIGNIHDNPELVGEKSE